jgi:hypothetical protein
MDGAGGMGSSSSSSADTFFALLEARFEALRGSGCLPVDLRAKGLRSAKYDYDGVSVGGEMK